MGSIDFTAWLDAQDDPEFKQEVEQKKREAEKEEKKEEKKEKYQEKKRSYLLLPHVQEGVFADRLESGFVNPYSFFPVESVAPDRTVPKIDYSAHTGKLQCSLKVKENSPLFIPNTTGIFEKMVKNKPHYSYDFFSLDDLSDAASESSDLPDNAPERPLIPGSAIRGVVRSIYEQLTNSCFSIIDENSRPIKRTNLPKKPFCMEYDESEKCWNLFNTEVLHLGKEHDPDNYRDKDNQELTAYKQVSVIKSHPYAGEKRNVKRTYVDEIGKAGIADTPQAYIHLTGKMSGKHISLLPVVDNRAGEKPVVSLAENCSAIRRLEYVLDAYCMPSNEKNHNEAIEGYSEYRKRLREKKTVLVYADDGKNPEYLAPSCMSPESFDTTVIELLDLQDKHAPCKGPTFCPACRLFGAISDNRSIGSRVRFGQGEPVENISFMEETITLPPLSSPRVSATEFYLKQPDGQEGGMWNFDYFLKNGNKEAKYKEMDDAGIQGRKVYWHHPFDLEGHYEDDQRKPSNQNVTVRPLKSGRFVFDVFFENLSSEELANLIFAIGGMGDGRLQKIGHGKPLGMGSVLMKVNKCKTKTYKLVDGRLESCESEIDSKWIEEEFEKLDDPVLGDELNKFRRRLIEIHAQDLNEIPLNAKSDTSLGSVVSYPKTEPKKIGRNNPAFEWFGKNRGNVNSPQIKNVITPMSVDDIKRDPDLQ